MIDDALTLRVERIASSLEELRRALRQTYSRNAQVNSALRRDDARRTAEEWMVQVANHPDVKVVLGAVIGDLNIEFTRLLTYSERRSLRRLYDAAIAAILRNFHARVVIPLKQAQSHPRATLPGLEPRSLRSAKSAFVGHSFAPVDEYVVSSVIRVVRAFNIRVETGERPSPRSVSEKVKRRIDRCDIFIGVFSRRDKLSRKNAYATSAWIIDEKAYALARDKKLVLLKDSLVDSIGGLQGDYEYLEFDPGDVLDLALRLVELFTAED